MQLSSDNHQRLEKFERSQNDDLASFIRERISISQLTDTKCIDAYWKIRRYIEEQDNDKRKFIASLPQEFNPYDNMIEEQKKRAHAAQVLQMINDGV